ncbi:hypothetical protein K493DRAFT_60224 [Basidiobolus meristosporus CBS 931.73]|uniref:Uncharacterized protein n=1 Tax=Basidiobolus meristosporus CBS 931.73 TaxID=1314790 RepID=A0A1Y1XX05_9FUNG|nr:hypothetical protein K493DRAFT_60224 [Basidiobolus meristosporus CBS 931.73]|eukprot:ORX90278.1 hypothetical protein K493DRAFT_60224 [Basidiobolus meristosporus CBS 931.73]
MYLVQKLSPATKPLAGSASPLVARFRGCGGFVHGKIFSTFPANSTTSEDDWDDLPNHSKSITFTQKYQPANSASGSIRSTSCSGLDLTPNLLVQQMLFNPDSEPKKHITADKDDDDEYFVSGAPTTLFYTSPSPVSPSL